MPNRLILPAGTITGLAMALALLPASAFAKSALQKECSEKYQAAKTANALNGQTYNQFYKQCSAEAKAEKGGTTPTTTAAPTPAPAVPTPTTTAAPAKPPVVEPTPTAAPAPAPAPVAPKTAAAPAPEAPAAVGNIVYPAAIDRSFASEKPGKARMQTCLAQYNANKPTNSNGGLKWIEKGGGYYHECNNRLKG